MIVSATWLLTSRISCHWQEDHWVMLFMGNSWPQQLFQHSGSTCGLLLLFTKLSLNLLFHCTLHTKGNKCKLDYCCDNNLIVRLVHHDSELLGSATWLTCVFGPCSISGFWIVDKLLSVFFCPYLRSDSANCTPPPGSSAHSLPISSAHLFSE